MFDKFRLKDVLVDYKKDFVSTEWGNEKYKWEAIRCFQDNLGCECQGLCRHAASFFDKTFNLLASMNNFPRRMIEVFTKRRRKKSVLCLLPL